MPSMEQAIPAAQRKRERVEREEMEIDREGKVIANVSQTLDAFLIYLQCVLQKNGENKKMLEREFLQNHSNQCNKCFIH